MPRKTSAKSLGIVIPVFNEQEALSDLFATLDKFEKSFEPGFRVIFVDDHSSDATPEMLKAQCEVNPNRSFVRLSSQSGSHAAILAGLNYCNEDFAAFIAADLQDPIELIPRMMKLCEEGNEVVWGNRDGRDGQGWIEHLSSLVFYSLMHRISNISNIPFQASFAVLSRKAYTALVRNVGPHASLVVEIPALGFPVSSIAFSKKRRLKGRSKWSVRGKILALADAIISSSYVPLRLMTYTGMVISFIGILYAILVLGLVLTDIVTVSGWASLMIVVLILGGFQILMLGIIGEYIWRISENTRRRALYLIEDSKNIEDNGKLNN